jgi:hypothetical protein
MAVGVARLALGGGTEHGRDVVVALDVGFVCEVQVAAVGLRLARKRVFEILFGLASFQVHGGLLGVVIGSYRVGLD